MNLTTNAYLHMTSGSGSIDIYFAKGTPIADIEATAKRLHSESTDDSHNGWSGIWANPVLHSAVTGKRLTVTVPFATQPVAPRSSIWKLSPRQKQVFALRHLHDKQVGDLLGISAASVRSYREELRRRLPADIL